jgi:hypothetical protein
MLVAPPAVAAETSSLSIQVFPDFLSEDELAYLSHVDAFISLEEVGQEYHGRTYGVAKLEKSLAERIHRTTGITAKDTGYRRAVPVTKIDTTTSIHHDIDGDGTLVQDKVAFIFLNSNEDAAFSHGDSEHVPVKAGTMVVFDGDVPHSTIVKSGSVRLAGAFRLDSFSAVGMIASCTTREDCAPGDKCVCGPGRGRNLLTNELDKAHEEALKEDELKDAQHRNLKKGKSTCPDFTGTCQTPTPKAPKAPKGTAV